MSRASDKNKIHAFFKDNNMGGALVYAKEDFLVYRMYDLFTDDDEDSYGIFFDGELVLECDTKQCAINEIENCLIYNRRLQL